MYNRIRKEESTSRLAKCRAGLACPWKRGRSVDAFFAIMSQFDTLLAQISDLEATNREGERKLMTVSQQASALEAEVSICAFEANLLVLSSGFELQRLPSCGGIQ